jgi:type VI protein secretion system component VasF
MRKRRLCTVWTIATIAAAGAVLALCLLNVRIGAWTSIGIAAGIAVTRIWLRENRNHR